MYKNRILPGIVFLTAAVLLAGCSGGGAAADDTAAADPVTPVAITHISSGPVSDTVTLSATSVFLQKNYVKANAIGYIQQVYVKPGQFVHQGQLLFVIKTKEAQSIGNTINVLDTTFKFSGVNRIKASGSGYITQLAHQLGDYVQDGEQLAVISDHNSFAFLMQLPYELHSLIANNKTLALTLPDGTNLRGTIASTMPNVDSLAQTQGLVVKVNSNDAIPENLVARAHLIKSAKAMATTLPKSAVLADESQTEFWVMKLLSDSLAVKVPIKKGIETQTQIEILSPALKPTDRIITTGNYGLADTAKIKITHP